MKKLSQEQRKWIEENYDIVDMVVEKLKPSGRDEDDIRSAANLAICEVVAGYEFVPPSQYRRDDILNETRWKSVLDVLLRNTISDMETTMPEEEIIRLIDGEEIGQEQE